MADARRAAGFGLLPALVVGLIVMAFYVVPDRVNAAIPDKFRIGPGTTFSVGDYRYEPDPTWNEDRRNTERGTVSTITNGTVRLMVAKVDGASTPEQAYEISADKLQGYLRELGVQLGEARPISTRNGVPGLRGSVTAPNHTGTMATFARDGNGLVVWADAPANPGISPEAESELDTMISSVERKG